MDFFTHAFFHEHIEPFISAILLILMGYLVARLLSSSIAKTLIKRLTPQQSMLLRRCVFYVLFGLFIASAFDQMGFHIGALLGAAGILTVALGIASQTSMSNIISGVFMIGEQPFEVGHHIRVGNTTGEVLSIDLLSVKIRTLDNTFVRIPNETLIKSDITNLSYFPIRRFDLKLGISYKEDLERVKTVLMDVAHKNPLSLIEPKPILQIIGFGDSSIDLQFSVWCSRPNFTELRYSIQEEILRALTENQIDMPFPSRTLYAGNENPLPIKIVTS